MHGETGPARVVFTDDMQFRLLLKMIAALDAHRHTDVRRNPYPSCAADHDADCSLYDQRLVMMTVCVLVSLVSARIRTLHRPAAS